MRLGSAMRWLVSLTIVLTACGTNDGVSRLVGARCEVARDCDDRCLQPSNDFPEGMCTLDCDRSDECTADTVCADKEGGVCLFACREARDCAFLGPGWTCREQKLRADGNTKVNVCMGD